MVGKDGQDRAAMIGARCMYARQVMTDEDHRHLQLQASRFRLTNPLLIPISLP
jgi:hypothetical protein